MGTRAPRRYQRPMELATLRLANMISVLSKCEPGFGFRAHAVSVLSKCEPGFGFRAHAVSVLSKCEPGFGFRANAVSVLSKCDQGLGSGLTRSQCSANAALGLNFRAQPGIWWEWSQGSTNAGQAAELRGEVHGTGTVCQCSHVRY
jgi:hypothetical protein